MARPYKGHLLTEEQKKIVEENVNFVWYYYGKYISERSKNLSETDKDELISELYFGLCLASEKYDPKKGKFLTIASWYFKSAVSRFFESRGTFNNSFELCPFIIDEKVDSHIGSKNLTRGVYEKKENNSIKFFEDKEYVLYLLENSNLTEKEKKIIVLYYINNLKVSDILSEIGSGKTMFYEYIGKAIKKMKDASFDLIEDKNG